MSDRLETKHSHVVSWKLLQEQILFYTLPYIEAVYVRPLHFLSNLCWQSNSNWICNVWTEFTSLVRSSMGLSYEDQPTFQGRRLPILLVLATSQR